MNSQFIAFLESLKDESTSDLLESITEAYSVLFEEPHFTFNGDREVHNNVPVTELSQLLKKSTNKDFKKLIKMKKGILGDKTNSPMVNPIPHTNIGDIPQAMDYFDLYMEFTGKKREDGKIHEPIRYISDIYRGKLVISPSTNTPIKITDKADRELFIDSIASHYIADKAIIQYLLDDKYNNPNRGMDKTSLLPDRFYSRVYDTGKFKKDAFRMGDEKISLAQALQYLKPEPASIHESK